MNEMKKIIHRIIVAVALLTTTSAFAADFDKGKKAYDKGDYKTALQEWRPLAEQGNAKAQHNMGLMYANGQGIPKNDRQAVSWYRKAAEQGLAEAQNNLGLMYANGHGVSKSNRRAISWYRKAAEQGLALAQNHMGLMYANGWGIRKDYRQAVSWYRKAAEQELALSQCNLGVMYFNGWGVPQDYNQAVSWYRKAAEQGLAEAHNNMGFMYLNGKGVLTDYIRAYAWFNLAVAQGYKNAEKARDGLQWRMTPSQLANAQELSREIESRIAQGYEGELDSLPVADASEPVLEEPEPELESNASGFVIGRDGETTFIVTNHHVVEDCDKVTVVYAGKLYEASVLAKDANSDLALLETNIPAARPASFSSLSRARLGEAVTAAGYPLQGLLSKSLNVTGGNVSALAGLGDDAKHLQITAPLQPGNSGGPLLDSSGNVVGVAASKLNAIAAAELTGDLPQNVNFAIKAALVRSFLDIHGVDYQRLPSETKLEPEKLAERARQFTVAVHCWK